MREEERLEDGLQDLDAEMGGAREDEVVHGFEQGESKAVIAIAGWVILGDGFDEVLDPLWGQDAPSGRDGSDERAHDRGPRL